MNSIKLIAKSAIIKYSYNVNALNVHDKCRFYLLIRLENLDEIEFPNFTANKRKFYLQ